MSNVYSSSHGDTTAVAGQVLKNLGLPATKNRTTALAAWFKFEGNNSGGSNGINNPLNIQGSNPVPYNYSTPAEGAKATADLIKNGYPGIFGALKSNSTPIQVAAAITNSPWASSHYGATPAPNGQGYVGGSLVNSFLGPAPHGESVLSAVGGSAEQLVTNPGKSLSQTTTAGTNAVQSALGLSGIEKDIVYGLAIVGGGLLMLVGFILIAADIGLDRFGKTKPAQKIGGAVSSARPSTRRANADNAAREQRQRDVKLYTSEARLYKAQSDAKAAKHRASVSKSNAKVSKAKAKARTGKTGTGFPKDY